MAAVDAEQLARIVAVARKQYPDIEVPDDELVSFLARHAVGASPQWLLELPAADIYLACACGRGDPAAIATIEAQYFPAIREIVRGKLGSAALSEEALQRMREHLFVTGHIRDYGGRGALGKWLTITAVRAGLRAIRETRRETELDEAQLGRLADAGGDVELEHMRQRYEPEFKQAFAEAFGKLTSRERNLLRHQVLDGLGVEAIAGLHNVNKSTVSRWLASARTQLMKQTRAHLRSRLGITASEAESILRLLADQHDVTLQTILRATKQ